MGLKLWLNEANLHYTLEGKHSAELMETITNPQVQPSPLQGSV
jgi:hypothetical protein